ncbi:hypothetical protein C823_006054 [Eubacterium plexicaudatum ASF492]|nr:hypothetical protein C823_006054 [Eubacterium plexicaudatum ASF492]
MGQEEIAYQNKDITSKVLAENFKGKTFRVYGLDLPEIREARPTDIPAIRANELRMDNLFELEDDTVAILDYESDYDKNDKVKYLNYLTGVANRYQKEKRGCPQLRMVVIYTGDISRGQVSSEYNIGAVKLHTETAFLSELDSDGIMERLKSKVERNKMLTDEELMEFIILPLSYRKKEEKEKRVRETVELAAKIQDRGQQVFTLAGILAFTDKIIDMETANKIRRAIEMTQVAMIFEEEKQQAVEAERKKAADLLEAERKKAAASEKQVVEKMLKKDIQRKKSYFWFLIIQKKMWKHYEKICNMPINGHFFYHFCEV